MKNILCLTSHLWASFHFVGHLLDISTHPFVKNKQRNKQRSRKTNVETESSIYIAAMSQLKNFSFFFENFLSLSLLRCGPDNNRTKEKRKTIKIKFEKKNFFLEKYSKSHFSFWWNFSKSDFFYPPLLFCWTFVGHFFIMEKHTEKQTDGQTDGETESSIYIAAMSQLKKKLKFLFSKKYINK